MFLENSNPNSLLLTQDSKNISLPSSSFHLTERSEHQPSEQVHPSYRVKRPRLFTKSGSYLKQYLVSERIPKDCDARIVKVLTGESKTFNFGGLPMRYFRGSEGFEGHNSTNPSEAR